MYIFWRFPVLILFSLSDQWGFCHEFYWFPLLLTFYSILSCVYLIVIVRRSVGINTITLDSLCTTIPHIILLYHYYANAPLDMPYYHTLSLILKLCLSKILLLVSVHDTYLSTSFYSPPTLTFYFYIAYLIVTTTRFNYCNLTILFWSNLLSLLLSTFAC